MKLSKGAAKREWRHAFNSTSLLYNKAMENKVCKSCGTRLIQKETKRTAEQLKKHYYYTAYYYCQHCKKIYHDESFKMINKTLFDNPVETPIIATRKEEYDVKIWTDGACTNNGKSTAKAAWAFVSGSTEKAALVDGKQTNNVAEGLAIFHALQWAAEKGYRNILLHTDSQISLFNLSKPAALVKMNQEIFQNIENLIKKNNLQVTYKKVLGHSGDHNNERADKLANQLAGKR